MAAIASVLLRWRDLLRPSFCSGGETCSGHRFAQVERLAPAIVQDLQRFGAPVPLAVAVAAVLAVLAVVVLLPLVG